MKNVFLSIFLLCILSWCNSGNSISEREIINRTVDITSSQIAGVHGKWVILENGKILTSRHVVKNCGSGCSLEIQWQKYPIGSIDFPDARKDIAYVSFSGSSDFSTLSLLNGEKISTGQSIVSYLSLSGSWQKVDGKILGIDTPYIAYDNSLSWTLLSGSILTDIILSPGESGTPIWTASWELVGVMSAVDNVGKRSYVVQ